MGELDFTLLLFIQQTCRLLTALSPIDLFTETKAVAPPVVIHPHSSLTYLQLCVLKRLRGLSVFVDSSGPFGQKR